ncbi:MAG: hypothetical protein IJG38_00205 [Thermoguttaceae bacterium]|nr:hypothetical protein [Thermoguttaceae bacterium]
MKKHDFWRLFNAAVLTTAVWSSMVLNVYGGLNNSSSGGTLLDVFRGHGSSSDPAPAVSAPIPSGNQTMIMPAPQMTHVPAAPNDYAQPYESGEGATQYPSAQYVPPAMPSPQPAAQNKWSIKNWFTGITPVSPSKQYVEPAPPLTPAHSQPHSHAPQPVMPNVQRQQQYSVVPLDSQDFLPQEGAIYNEKGEMIYNPESGEPMPNFAAGETLQNGNEWEATSDENMQGAPAVPFEAYNSQVVTNTINESESAAKRVIMGRSARRSAAPVNQERVYSQQQVYPNESAASTPQPIPARMPINPYAQHATVSAGNPPVGTGKAIINGNSGALKLDSGASAFSKTYKPVPRVTNVPTDPVMDMAGPDLADAMPQEAETSPAVSKNIVGNRAVVKVEPAASKPAQSPVIEELFNASPLENLSEKSVQTPVLEPVPEPVPEIDVPKETVGSRQEAAGSSNSPEENSTPLATRNSQLATPQSGSRQEAVGSSNSPEANSTPLATRNSQHATQTAPLLIDISGPEEVEYGKNEMFSLSVINTTDAVRQDVVLSVHPEGFGDDKTASLTLEQLAPGEKKSVSMKLNARQHNNLSLTAHVQDAQGYETTKKISVNVKNESVKISILPPQTGTAFVGQPTQYIVRIVNNAQKVVSLNAVAFFGNGIEPIRATGAPNTIQSGQVVVNKPIELKQGEMRDLKIIAVAFQPGVHKILIQLMDSRGATYAAKESCAYRQRELEEDETETIETDARIELTPGKSEIGVWKAAGPSSNRSEAVDSSDSPEANSNTPSSPAPALNDPDAVPLTQPDQGSRGDLIMPMFAQ